MLYKGLVFNLASRAASPNACLLDGPVDIVLRKIEGSRNENCFFAIYIYIYI